MYGLYIVLLVSLWECDMRDGASCSTILANRKVAKNNAEFPYSPLLLHYHGDQKWTLALVQYQCLDHGCYLNFTSVSNNVLFQFPDSSRPCIAGRLLSLLSLSQSVNVPHSLLIVHDHYTCEEYWTIRVWVWFSHD